MKQTIEIYTCYVNIHYLMKCLWYRLSGACWVGLTLIYKFHPETCMEQQMEFNFESSIRGYHVYKSSGHTRSARNFVVTEKKIIQMTNLLWNYGNKECVGHMPIEHSKAFKFFLKRDGKIFATVIGNKFFNIGLELPCTYTF